MGCASLVDMCSGYIDPVDRVLIRFPFAFVAYFPRLGSIVAEFLFVWVWTKWIEWREEDSLSTLFTFSSFSDES